MPSPSTAPDPDTSALVRPARPEDAPVILAIRADAIRTGTALWTDTVPSPSEGAAWFAAHLERSSIVVAEVGGEVAGFACYGPWRPYDGYRFTAEDSVYLTEATRGRGLGRLLLTALVERAREAGMHSMIGNIEGANLASIALHERCGFQVVGRVPQAGWKFDRWLDLVIMQRMLAPGS